MNVYYTLLKTDFTAEAVSMLKDFSTILSVLIATFIVVNAVIWISFKLYAKTSFREKLNNIIFYYDEFADDMSNAEKRKSAIADINALLTWRKYFIPTCLVGWIIDAEVKAIRKMQEEIGVDTDLHKEE